MADNDQGKPESAPAVPTADGTPAGAPASDATQTITPPAEERQASGAAVDEYEQELRDALSVVDPEEAPPVVTPEQQPEAQAPEAAAGTTPETPPEESPSGEQPPQQEPEKRDVRVRLNTLDARQQEAVLLVKAEAEAGRKISLAEAERRVNIKYDGEPTPEASTPKPDAPKPRTVEEIEADISAADKEWRAAKKAIDPDAELAAWDKMQAFNAELSSVKHAQESAKAEQAQRAEREFEAAVDAADAEASQMYPQKDDPNHAINAKAQEIWGRMLATNNPITSDPRAAVTVYQMAANELGIPPAGANRTAPAITPPATTPHSSTPAPQRPQAVQQTAVRRPTAASPAPGSARTSQPGPTIDPVEQIKDVNDYDNFVGR